jgi:hypothetical protein
MSQYGSGASHRLDRAQLLDAYPHLCCAGLSYAVWPAHGTRATWSGTNAFSFVIPSLAVPLAGVSSRRQSCEGEGDRKAYFERSRDQTHSLCRRPRHSADF